MNNTNKNADYKLGDEWDEIVSSANGHIFQTFHWAKVAETTGCTAVPFRVHDSVLMAYQQPVFSARKIGIVRSSLVILRGPVFRGGVVNSEDFKLMIDELENYAQQNKIAICHWFPSSLFGSQEPHLLLEAVRYEQTYNTSGFHTQTYVVDCTRPIDELFGKMEKRTRWSVRKSEKAGCTVEEDSSPEGVSKFYLLCRTTGQSIPSEEFFKNAMRLLGAKGMARIFFTRVNEMSVSSAFVLMFGKKMFYVWGGNDSAYRRLCPGELLHWKIIQWGKENGFKFYDLHGALVEDSSFYKPTKRLSKSKLESVALFKRGFGGTFVRYLPEHRKVYSKFGTYVLGQLPRLSRRLTI